MNLSRKPHTEAQSHGGINHRIRLKIIASIILTLAILFAGCSPDPKDPSGLHGTWVSEFGERFIIDLANKTLQHYYVGEYESFCFEGNIHEIVYFNKTAGIIFIEFTDIADWWVKQTGNFSGIYFVNLTSTAVELSNAAAGEWPESYTPTTTTLVDAKIRFNVDMIDEYFSITSACLKQ